VSAQDGVGRVLAGRYRHCLDEEAASDALIEPGQHGALARLVGIEREQHPAGVEPRQRLGLLAGERGAERRDGVGETRLVEREDVHVALDDDDLAGLADGGAGPIEAVEQRRLLEQLGLGSVEVLRERVVQHAAREARPRARGGP
jgi:hypothetical protein